jgi:spectinomycin phosphotransferase
MLEKPVLADHSILSSVQDVYGLQVARVTFLPLGADVNTAVYRVDSMDKTAYFLKLRKGNFAEITVTLPLFLKAQGIQAILAPLKTRDRQFWTELDAYKVVLYPFVEGKNGYEAALSDSQWVDFGAALKAIHSTLLPPELARLIQPETYSPHYRELVKVFQAQAEKTTFDDPTAAKLAEFMRSRRSEIDALIAHADQLGRNLQARSPHLVLCHSDIHAGNLLLGAKDALYIVDWDNPIFAPKELDLAMVGGSTIWNSARQEALFYQGYGQVKIDPAALAYYHYERIILDIAEFCKQLFLTTGGGVDREQSYQYFTSNFLPNHEVEIAFKTDKSQAYHH